MKPETTTVQMDVPGHGSDSRPDARGYFGPFGGRFVAETVIAALDELSEALVAVRNDPTFWEEHRRLLEGYVGRPTPLTSADSLFVRLGGARVLLKREDLCHTGAHKINNTLGQVRLAVRMGKKAVAAETGAGQHGVATATAAALFGLPCKVFMGEVDMRRQTANVARMRLLGAEVVPVVTGSRTLKDAMNEALRYWISNVETTHYVIGSTAGPHPYPVMVRDFQRVIGDEARAQCLDMLGRLPDMVVACVGGGSNALGMFTAFLDDPVELVMVEAAGAGLDSGAHAAAVARGRLGVLHGQKSLFLQTRDGQIEEAHSISAGLDYPGVGPEIAWLASSGRARMESATDAEALEAFDLLARAQGILPALESAHAVAAVARLAPTLSPEQCILVNLSGRGDKDVDVVLAHQVASRGERP